MLTSETVAKIKSYLEDGHRIGEIAAAYQISRQAVSKIASGRTHAGVRPARSVPALSKEADRIRQANRAAQLKALRLHQRAVQQQQVSEFKQQSDAAIRDEQRRRLDAERRTVELARQVEELTRQQAQTTPAAHEPAAPAVPLMDTGQPQPADTLDVKTAEEKYLRARDAYSAASNDPDCSPEDRRRAMDKMNLAHSARQKAKKTEREEQAHTPTP